MWLKSFQSHMSGISPCVTPSGVWREDEEDEENEGGGGEGGRRMKKGGG